MAATPVLQFPVPSAYAAGFTNGEMALAVFSPLTSTPGPQSYFLSKWFDFDGGLYVFKSVADDGAAWFASVESGSGALLFSQTVSDGVVTSTVFIPRGRKRLDIMLTNIANASTCFVAFSIWREGLPVYISGSSGWLYDTVIMADSALSAPVDRRRTLPVFALQPNWKDGILERVEYLTEIESSESDDEQRRSLRRYPRRTFEMQFLRKGPERTRLDAFLTGVGSNELLLPLWHEQYRLTVNAGQVISVPELANREFRAGELVIFTEKRPDVYEIGEIASVDLLANTITLVAAPAQTWGLGSRLIPLRVVRRIEQAGYSLLTDDTAQYTIRFKLEGPQKWPDADWGYCVPLFRFPVNRADAISINVERNTFSIDNDVGVLDFFDTKDLSRVTYRLQCLLRGREQATRFRAFLQMARGRAVRFWIPAHSNDIYPTGDFSGSYLDAKDVGFSDYVKTIQDARKMVAIIYNDGRPNVYREITKVERFAGKERYYFTEPLPPTSIATVSRLMFVIPARFEQDAFELNHLVDDSAAVQTAVVVRSADREGLPLIECLVTSRPYPLAYAEAMDVSIGFVSGRLAEIGSQPEAMDVTIGFTSATLETLVERYEYQPEALNAVLAFTGGSVTLDLKTTTMTPEGLDAVISFAGGSIPVKLIISTMRPEGVDPTISFVGGTLS